MTGGRLAESLFRSRANEGLLEVRRGRGISVVGTTERGAVIQRTRELIQYARRHGYRPDDLIEIIHDLGQHPAHA